ncbi:stabilin-2 [Danio aesculapii]|uniref:stabilin-2 n=1 Tax=Danio aesculapii TaxID=1142201 RepID=UPI0024C04F61|nr:stabilin-2 [Danio aesculapii]
MHVPSRLCRQRKSMHLTIVFLTLKFGASLRSLPSEQRYRNQSIDLLKLTPENTRIMRYHIVCCRTLLPQDFMQPRNLTTLSGDILTITYSEDTDTLKLVMDPIHQPVTLFMPTDDAMSALAQEQKDFLYAMHNRDKLSEYLRYHVLRDTKLLTSELIYASSLKTQQGSDLSVACIGEEQIGELYVNHKGCRIVKRYLDFNGGMIYGIDCLLNPPSLGGRCDHKQTIDFTLACRRCGSSIMDCPLGSKPVTLSGRDIEHHLLDGRALILQALINVTHVRTRLGSSLTITGVPDLQNPQKMTSSGYINDRYVIDSNIFASNGVIHVLQGPLKAPSPPPPSFHSAH